MLFLRTRLRALSWMCGATVALSGCANLSQGVQAVRVYVPEVVQGNVVTREDLAAISVGMPADAVQQTLGSPLLRSLFHGDRWDYIFTYSKPGQPDQERRVTIYFEQQRVSKIVADELPSETEFVGTLPRQKTPGVTPKLALSEAELAALKAKASPVLSDAAPPVPTMTQYPPLESN